LHTIISSQEKVAFHLEIELKAAIPKSRISVSIVDSQGLVLLTQDSMLEQTKAGKISLILELPILPLKPGDYIVSCTISEGDHQIASLRAIPELTVVEELNSERSAYHGVLNLPAKLFVK
jgi:hypothetical protein